MLRAGHAASGVTQKTCGLSPSQVTSFCKPHLPFFRGPDPADYKLTQAPSVSCDFKDTVLGKVGYSAGECSDKFGPELPTRASCVPPPHGVAAAWVWESSSSWLLAWWWPLGSGFSHIRLPPTHPGSK